MSRKLCSQWKDSTLLLNENTNTEWEKQWGQLWFPAHSQHLIDRRFRVALTPKETWRDNCLEPRQHAVKADDWVELFPRPAVCFFGSGTPPPPCLSDDPPWTATALKSLAEAFVRHRRFEMQDAVAAVGSSSLAARCGSRATAALLDCCVSKISSWQQLCVQVSVCLCVCVNTASKGLVRASGSPWTYWVSPVGLAASSAGWRSVFLPGSATAALSPDTHRIHGYAQSRVNFNFHDKTVLIGMFTPVFRLKWFISQIGKKISQNHWQNLKTEDKSCRSKCLVCQFFRSEKAWWARCSQTTSHALKFWVLVDKVGDTVVQWFALSPHS